MFTSSRWAAVLAIVALLAASPVVLAKTTAPGTMTDLGPLGNRVAMNNRGQIVGSMDTEDGVANAFLWEDGRMTDLGSLFGGDTEALGINDRGQVVGDSYNAEGYRRAFLWERGVMTALDTLPGFGDSVAYAINNRGQIVGFQLLRRGPRRALARRHDRRPRHARVWQRCSSHQRPGPGCRHE